jgi:hypothetical protein
MLTRHSYASLALYLVLPAALVGGCVVASEPSDTDTDIDQTSTSASSGTSGSGGSGGSTGQGGYGGQGVCVGADGTGQTVAACDTLNISPTQGASRQCGVGLNEDPFGYVFCKRAFTLFTPGQTEDLVACLATIGVQSACDAQPVQDCVDQMYAHACTYTAISETCSQISTQCSTSTDPGINVELCIAQLNPFSSSGLQQLVDCMDPTNNPDLTCQQAYDTCVEQLESF